MRKVLVLSAALALVGCASPAKNKVAIMYNPETKDTKECRVDGWTTWQWQYAEVLQQCINGYEQAGYRRVDN